MNHMDDQRRRSLQADDLDRTLDAALAKYAAVEPRAGLEDRILARVRAEALRPVRRARLQWGWAGALAAIAIIAVLVWRSSGVPHPVIANHPPAAIQRTPIRETRPAPEATVQVGTVKRASVRKPAEHREHASTATDRPKLDQFPSRQPLSAEELALAQYVKTFPKEARLVAQAQEEFELETQKEMNDAGPSGSIQRER
jgi:hypothetical protein